MCKLRQSIHSQANSPKNNMDKITGRIHHNSLQWGLKPKIRPKLKQSSL